jgi:hypothetical protein
MRRTFRSTALTCPQCAATDKDCPTCGKTFRGYQTVCRFMPYHRPDMHLMRTHFPRRPARMLSLPHTERQCITCGTTFRAGGLLECLTCSGRASVYNAQRRIRRARRADSTDLSRELSTGQSSPPDPASTAVNPAPDLTTCGRSPEAAKMAASNLVPACKDCNSRK